MARICEGVDCGTQVGLPSVPAEAFTDPLGVEHDFCRTCWEKPVPCAGCGGDVRRNDPRVAQTMIPPPDGTEETCLVFAHSRCVQAAAKAYFKLIAAGREPPTDPPEQPRRNGTH